MDGCCDRAILRYLRASGGIDRGEFLALLGAAAMAGCSSTVPSSTVPSAPTESPAPSSPLLLTNGTFITLGKSNAVVGAIAIAGGTIMAVANSLASLQQQYPNAPVYDLNGATLAPGFVEAHAHLSQAVLNLACKDLSPYGSMHDVLAAMRKFARRAKKGEWVFAQGVDTSLLPPTYAPPTFAELNSISSTVPVFIEDSTGHLAYVNEAALKAARVLPGQTFPAGGLIGSQSDGRLGMVYELSAFSPFFTAGKPTVAPAKLAAALVELLVGAHRAGCTTWHDPAAGLIGTSLKENLEIYEALAANPLMPVRLISSVVLTDVEQVPPLVNPPRTSPGAGVYYGAGNALYLPALKIWVDGTPQGETAAMTERYRSNTAGFPFGREDWSSAALQNRIEFARSNGWSILLHTNGDAAIDLALQTIEAVFGGSGLPDEFRVRLEHCTVTREDQFSKMKALGVTPTFLNNHTYIWGDAFYERILGSARAQRLDAAGDAVRNGVIFSFHCDYGISPCDPLRYMQTAVTRMTDTGMVLGANQAITALEALKGCTIYPAMQLGLDDQIGTIEAGKVADFVELGANPTTVDPSSIASIPVRATWRAGKRIAVLTA